MKITSLKLNLDDSLGFTNTNKLEVKISPRADNTLTVEADGLYAEAIPGEPGPTGTGYPDGYRSNMTGVKTGEDFPDSTNSCPRRIVGPKILHRVYTAAELEGELSDLRDVDVLFPGDLFRVENTTDEVWEYYIITRTDGTEIIEYSGMIASIPFANTDVN